MISSELLKKFFIAGLIFAALAALAAQEVKDTKLSIILGRPTDNSVVVSILSAENFNGYIEYGTSSGNYTNKTDTFSIASGKPAEISLNNLQSDTQYFYRLRIQNSRGTLLQTQPEYSFHTQRTAGSKFTFVVQADSHLDEQSDIELYKRTLSNEVADKPDFMIDLGDTFMTEKLNGINIANLQDRYVLQRSFFSLAAHSVPLYLVLGNHDGEAGWLFNMKENNFAVFSTKTRKAYFPNPQPDNFYSGNTDSEKFIGQPENYYAWTWGGALFVVLDPYRYTAQKPGRRIDNWGWTLGERQYNWFKNTLEKSKAKFKFVFCHQLIGGGDTQARGGAEFAKYYEMGGFNKDNTWGFDSKRPGWEKPIHQLMVENNVTIFFHGHDHFFDKQKLDGVIYQLVPQPSHPNFKSAGQAQSYGYINGEILPNSGYLHVTVSQENAVIEYIRTIHEENKTSELENKKIFYGYTIKQ